MIKLTGSCRRLNHQEKNNVVPILSLGNESVRLEKHDDVPWSLIDGYLRQASLSSDLFP